MLIAGLMTANINNLQPVQPQANFAEKTVVVKKAVRQEGARQERFDRTFQLAPNGRVSLANVNGDVIVNGWDRNEVRVEAVKTVDCDKPQEIQIQVEANPNSIKIETEFGKNDDNVIINNGGNSDNKVIVNNGGKETKSWSYGYNNRCRRLSVDYKLTVPRTAQLDEIESVNGNITLEGVTNVVKTSTINGRISARDLRGSVNVSTVNGTLDVGFASLDNVRDIRVNLVNGKLDLQLPSDADATLKASTVHGAINNDFGLPVRKGEYVGNNLYGQLGDGKIQIKLSSVNGTIGIRRNSDGRSTRPVTNLLSQLTDEGHFDSPHTVSAPRAPRTPRPPRPPRPPRAPAAPAIDPGEVINQEVRNAIRESATESAKAAKEALKAANLDSRKIREELRKAQSEIDMNIDVDVDTDINVDIDRDISRNFSMSERKSESIKVEGVPNVSINARGGGVRIRGWDRQEVSYAFVGRGGGDFRVSMQKSGADVNLRVPANAEDFRLEVYVPRKSNIKVTSGGEIRVEGVSGKLELNGTNKSVDVRDSSGNLRIAAGEGRIRVIGFEGEVDAKTAAGDIALEGNFTCLSTNTVSGETILTLDEKTSAMLEATTKDVVFDGIIPNGDSKDTKNSTIWRIGEGSPANYKMRTTAGGQIIVRSANRVRVLRNFILSPLEKIFGE